MELGWIKGLVLVFTLFNFSTAATIDLLNNDCSEAFALPWNYSSTVVEVRPRYGNVFGNDCSVTFYTEDKAADIIFEFVTDDDAYSYIGNDKVSIFIYWNSNAGPTLVRNYTSQNSGDMVSLNSKPWRTGSITVTINGAYRDFWALYFSVRATDGPISGYPFSIACGVIALSLGGTTVLTLLLVACWCCCRSDNSRNRRRVRVIHQLRKEGYSVTRNYGATNDTTPILANDDGRDIFSQPSTHDAPTRFLPRGASNSDPPPPYHSVRPGQQTLPVQQSSSNCTANNTPVESTGQYNANFSSNPRPNVVISRSDGNQAATTSMSTNQIQGNRVVPEAILIEIETNPFSSDRHEDLMQFGTPPTAPVLPTVDLLGNDFHSHTQPAFGEAY